MCLQRKVGQPGVRARPVSVCQMESTAREVCLVIGNNKLLYRSQFLGVFPAMDAAPQIAAAFSHFRKAAQTLGAYSAK